MKKIYVGNLSYDSKENEIEELFAAHGDITALKLIRDHETGRSKGFCFIEYQTPGQAKAALELNGQEFQGRSLRVSIARERQGGNRSEGRSDRR